MCLLKIGACLIQVCFNVFACFGKLIHACLIQAACLDRFYYILTLKVGSFSFECIIILLIYFIIRKEAIFIRK